MTGVNAERLSRLQLTERPIHLEAVGETADSSTSVTLWIGAGAVEHAPGSVCFRHRDGDVRRRALSRIR